MARKSTIDKLPPEIRKEIARLRDVEGLSIDAILERLRGAAPDLSISRSAMGRHVKRIDAMGALLKESREAAVALVSGLGERGEGDVQRLNTEMAQALITRFMMREDGKPVELDAQETMFLSSAIKSLTAASRDNAAFVEKVEKRAAARAADAAKAAVRKAGLSAEIADQIAATILGVAPSQPGAPV
ncbi:MAG: DUF3486 family protein [Tagaea sp.]|nr:DUF3486 family protein [Tagaea sp.]